jgi:hypothetical protein
LDAKKPPQGVIIASEFTAKAAAFAFARDWGRRQTENFQQQVSIGRGQIVAHWEKFLGE